MDVPGQDVRLAGGVSAIQQYLRAGLVDEMHLAYGPMLLGSGERLYDNLVDAEQVRLRRVCGYTNRASRPLRA
jgi:dihydrofolate reductase